MTLHTSAHTVVLGVLLVALAVLPDSLVRRNGPLLRDSKVHIVLNHAQIVFLALILSAQVRRASRRGCAAHATCRGASPRCAGAATSPLALISCQQEVDTH